MKKTICYIRVSSEKQVDNFSLPSQKKAVLKYCKEHKYKNVEVISDPGKSAKTLDRPGIREILEYVEMGLVERIVIIELDRLTRDVEDQSKLIKLFHKHNVKLEGVYETIDTDSPQGKLQANIRGAFNQWDNDNRGCKTRRGMVEKASQGQYALGNVVSYGFKKSKKHYLVAVNSELEVIKRMFDLYVYHNYSEKVTAEKIEEEFGVSFSKKNIYNFLTKPLYRGFITVDKIDFPPKCEYLDTNDEAKLNKYLLSNKVPKTELKPVITDEMYEDLLNRKKVKRYSKQKYKYRNLVYINGIKANQEHQRKNGKEYWYYYADITGNSTKGIYINQDEIDVAIRKKISLIKQEEYNEFFENINMITTAFATSQIDKISFDEKVSRLRNEYERLTININRIFVNTDGVNHKIQVE